MNPIKDKVVAKAVLAKECGRYEDYRILITHVVEMGTELTDEERDLFCAAFIIAINDRRTAIDRLSYVERLTLSSVRQRSILGNYIVELEEEIYSLCHIMLNLLNKYMFPQTYDSLANAFYLKLKADLTRYLTETSICSNRDELLSETKIIYEMALHISKCVLSPKHPTRMGIALNYSVFLYDILHLEQDARYIAQQAVTDIWMDVYDEKLLDNSILVYLKHNLHLWKRDLTHETGVMFIPPMREMYVEKAIIAYEAGRYEEMVIAINNFIKTEIELNEEEQELFIVCYKTLVDQRKSSLNKILKFRNSSTEPKKSVKVRNRRKFIFRQYNHKIKKELEVICLQALDLLDKYLLPNVTDPLSKVCYLSMKAEYYKHLVQTKIYTTVNIARASESFVKAYHSAKANLEPIDSTRLELAINYSEFVYKVLHTKQKAIEIANEALNEAKEGGNNNQLDNLHLLKKLKGNLKAWRKKSCRKQKK